MTPEQVSNYLGKEYRRDGDGPEEWGCWYLLRHCLREYYGVILPLAPVGDLEACRGIYSSRVRSGAWIPVSTPEDGSPVLMRGGREPHVGLYLDIDGGGILHSLEDVGVVFSTPQSCAAMGFCELKFYKVKNDENHPDG